MNKEIISIGHYPCVNGNGEVWMGEFEYGYIYVPYLPDDKSTYEVHIARTASAMFRFCGEFSSVDEAKQIGVVIDRKSGLPDYLTDQIKNDIISKVGNIGGGSKFNDDELISALIK